MKKSLSLLMLMAMVVGLYAAPVASKHKKVSKSTSRMELVQKQKVARKAPMAATVTFEPADFAGQGTEGTGGPVSVKKGGVTVSTDMGFGHRAYNPNTQKSDGAPDQFRVYKGGTLSIAASVTITKIEFTFEDDKDGFLETSYTPNSASWSETLSAQARISLIVVTLDGDTPTPPTPASDTIYSVINHPMVLDSIADFGWIYVSGENEEYGLSVQVNTNHLYGEYTNDDIDMEYTMLIDWTAYEYVDIESVPSVAIAQVADTLRFTATIKATDGMVYIITLNDFVTQPTGETTYVNIMLPEVYDETETEGWFQAMGYDLAGEYYASFCVNTTELFGTFTTNDIDWEYTSVYIGETAIQLDKKSLTISVSTAGDTVVYYGEAYDVAGMKWVITMKDFTPTPTEVIDLVTIEATGEYSAEDGDYYAQGTTENGDQISLDIYMDKLASDTFTLDDIETYYSGIMLATGQLVEFYSADITLTVEGGNVLIEAVIIGRNVKQYNVTMEIVGKQPSGDNTIVIADYQEVSFTTSDGAYTIVTSQNGGTSAPAYNTNGADLRLYAKNTMTLTKNTKNGPMTEVVFSISSKGLTRQAEITVSTGKITSYDMDNATVTWQGNDSEIVFTVGEKATYGSDGSSKAGQFDFTAITISSEGGDVPPTPITETEIKDLVYADAIYYEEDGNHYWDFDLYKDYTEDGYIYPDMYLMIADPATSKTSIVGTYMLGYAVYYASANDSVETDEMNPVGTLTISHVSGDTYRFQGSFVGTDTKTYTFNVTVDVAAYDWDNETEIILDEGGDSSLDETATTVKPVKFMRNGQIYIQRGDEVFTLMGTIVK
ncbi:MAG: hypothetical protein MJZ88_02695 [Paludibacteraceae bacterium]|nr:hypothetical protein [Paludibacteraceae bacterium]